MFRGSATTEILKQAQSFRDDGADVIDLGCIPGERWPRAGVVTRLLREHDFRVSIDSFDRHEVERGGCRRRRTGFER